MIERTEIVNMINGHLADGPLFLMDVIIKPGNLIMVFIDSDREVDIDDCAALSRFIESHLNRDVEDYELRVSSAGIDHPYVFLRQYRKNVGRQVQVLMKDDTIIRGTLLKAGEKFIEVKPVKIKGRKEQEISSCRLPFDQIKETRGIVTFDSHNIA
ncbi:MAG: ribosome assembly cofactor RimP [Lentimicrobiaceae bacterium]|nr:ribosome assembly cofactor RimP [Lentimicrobiaceae bacterium]